MKKMHISPVYGKRALRVVGDQRIIVVGDLHLGITAEFADEGIGLPSQILESKERILNLIEREDASRLIFLGDVKHNVPITSWQEWRDLPDFFSELAEHVQIEIIPGNHDGDIDGLVHRGAVIHNSRGILLGDGEIGLFHGHTWPDPGIMSAGTVVTAHNHPMIEFRDELGTRIAEPAWLKCEVKSEELPKRIEKIESTPEILVMPSFSKLVGGSIVNREMSDELLGPMFKSGAIDVGESEVYLLDGTFLGKVKNWKGQIKDLNE